jgi:bifunctional UDP-N-acetylglucosamine pyrophosphorylase/glucosamine-1-phosphate N-acetyltransferase
MEPRSADRTRLAWSIELDRDPFMSVLAIILAAGKSTRMKSTRPKVLHEVCGRPMLDHVLRACWEAGVTRAVVVVGYAKELVQAAFAGDQRIVWVEQTEQLGTGHAAKCASAELKKHPGNVFILAGDGPMIRGQVLQTLLNAHTDDNADASMATAVLDDPTGYGRIIRDAAGNFLDIVEQSDGTPEQLAIREIFPSYYCFKSEALLTALASLKNENRKREYYLTDTFAILRRMGRKITAVQAVAPDDVLAANTRAELAAVDAAMQARIQRHHRDAGVTLVSSEQTYIEAGAQIGVDTVVQPFTHIGRDAVIGANCTIGPFVRIPREAIVPEETVVEDKA